MYESAKGQASAPVRVSHNKVRSRGWSPGAGPEQQGAADIKGGKKVENADFEVVDDSKKGNGGDTDLKY